MFVLFENVDVIATKLSLPLLQSTRSIWVGGYNSSYIIYSLKNLINIKINKK